MSKPRERVAELERRVEELEATVEGLTEELVDRTERIRLLERRLDGEAPRDEGAGDDAEVVEDAGPEPASEATKPPEPQESEEEEGEATDDIIVA